MSMTGLSRGLVLGGLGIVALLATPAIPRAQAPVTFNKDVAPIFNKNCASCHRAGEMAPMSLTSFKDARPWANAIRKAVIERAMPPWGADPAFGEFANSLRLSDQELATIAAWVGGGSLEGDARDLPAPPVFTDGWHIGTPDAVLSMSAPADVPASGPRILVDFKIQTHFSEDKYLELAEVTPGNRPVTHHAVISVQDESGSHRIASYLPGGAVNSFPPGVAKLIPKDTTLNLNMHYNPKGTATTDKTTMAFVFAKGPIEKIAVTAMLGTRDLDIPPGAANYEAKGTPFVFAGDSHILSLLPRMNERGKDYKYTLVYPDGRSVVLLSVPKFNDSWQPSYILKTPIAAPKGSRIETIAHYDNSANNKQNPDPTARIKYGPEIMNGYFDYTVDSQNLLKNTTRAAAQP